MRLGDCELSQVYELVFGDLEACNVLVLEFFGFARLGFPFDGARKYEGDRLRTNLAPP